MVGDRGHQALELGAVNQLLMSEAAQPEIVHPRAIVGELGLGLRDQHRAVAFEAAIVAHQVLDVLPQLHRRDRERDLREMPRQLSHAAGIDARGMAAGIVLLDQDRLQPSQG